MMTIEFVPPPSASGWARAQGVDTEIKGAILAAGLGKRMEPLSSRHLPKPMFPLGGSVPMVELWVRTLVASGISSISMNLCVHGPTIKSHFQDGKNFCAEITYAEEENPTGTIGGVCKQVLGRESRTVTPGEAACTLEAFDGSTVIIPSGDIVTSFGPAQLEEMYQLHKRKGAAVTAVLTPVPWNRRGDFGTALLADTESSEGKISVTGRLIDFFEKDPDSPSNLNNASIYMIEAELIRELDALRTAVDPADPRSFYDFGKHGFPALLQRHPELHLPRDCPILGIQFDGLWYDVGTKRDYLRVNGAMLDGKIDAALPYERLPWGHLGTDVDIDFARVTIVPPVVIGDSCVVEPGCALGPYAVIGDGWKIEGSARVRRSVLWPRCSQFDAGGSEIPADRLSVIDPHEVQHGVTVEDCIVAGGAVDRDVRGMTVMSTEEGDLDVRPLDWVPDGPRA